MRIISILVLAMILWLSPASPALADVGEARHEAKEIDGYRIELTFVEGDPQLGHNRLSIEIKDSRGQPVDHARVRVIAELYPETAKDSGKDENGHSGMQSSVPKAVSVVTPIRTATAEMKAGQESGQYEGGVDLEEAGHWMMKVVSLIQSQEKVAEFVVDVHGAPSSWVVLWMFLGINVGIISVAAITRRKSASTPALEETR